jgi:uncharacterized membrane protein
MAKEDFYRKIKIIGFVTFIPCILAAGPLSGYFIGIFLREKFNLPFYVVFFGVGIGFLGAFMEVIKILKAVNRINK